VIQNYIKARKDGAFDVDLENIIKRPYMSKAEDNYNAYMNINGNKVIPQKSVNAFYENHPVAGDIIKELREIDPRAFDGVEAGSLAEFDILKRTLREEAGNKGHTGASRAGAAKRAENAIKTMLDNEASGFKKVNKEYASASTQQKIFEQELEKNINSIANVQKSNFWSGISTPLSVASALGGYFNLAVAVAAGGGLIGKAGLRQIRRSAGRSLINPTVKEAMNPKTQRLLISPGVVSIRDVLHHMLQI
jgi:hypothetical protein